MTPGPAAARQVPVLLVGFNRPDRLAALVERLRPTAPERVYLAVDGPRADRPAERELVERTRAVAEQVDWTEVRTLFREQNVGCGRGVSGAVDWLFAHEERGVVLEDDLLPSPDFLPFCAELLERYAGDDRVWAVSGCNFVPDEGRTGSASYRFSRVPHVWGWGTWRRAWQHYRLDVSGWRRDLPLRRLPAAAGSLPAAAYWSALFTLVERGRIDTWDYQLVLAAMRRGALTATANVNLVENVGFSAEATHTLEAPDYLQPVAPLGFPLRHPPAVEVDPTAEAWTREHVLGATAGGVARQAGALAARTLRRTS